MQGADASANGLPVGVLRSLPVGLLASYHYSQSGLAATRQWRSRRLLRLFLILAWHHNKLEDRLQRPRRWQRIKEAHVARIRLDWADIPQRQAAVPERHGYAKDLDLAGPRSLLHLIDRTISSQGQERLTSWLLDQPPQSSQWSARQALDSRIDSPLAPERPVVVGSPGGRGRRYRRSPIARQCCRSAWIIPAWCPCS